VPPTHDSPQPADRSLPEGWTIRARTALGLTGLSLHDEDSDFRQANYHEQTASPAHADARTILRALESLPAAHVYHTLGDVPKPLRAAAQTLINGYFENLAQTGAEAAALREAIGDFDTLTARLCHQVPACRIDAHRDEASGRYSLMLAATGPAAGQLLTLLSAFPPAARAADEELPDGITIDLDATLTLTVTIHARHALTFLDWFRTEPGVDDDADTEGGDGSERRVGEKEHAEDMAGQLRRIDVEADTANTGSTCWVAVVPFSERLHLEVFRPQGEGWSWTLHCDAEQVDAGYWPATNAAGAARLVKRWKESRGVTVA